MKNQNILMCVKNRNIMHMPTSRICHNYFPHTGVFFASTHTHHAITSTTETRPRSAAKCSAVKLCHSLFVALTLAVEASLQEHASVYCGHDGNKLLCSWPSGKHIAVRHLYTHTHTHMHTLIRELAFASACARSWPAVLEPTRKNIYARSQCRMLGNMSLQCDGVYRSHSKSDGNVFVFRFC